MACSCKELERTHGSGKCKCVHYRETFPECECEGVSVSDHSPGIVADDEVLIRTIYSPVHYNRVTGEVNPAAFSDVIDKGLSVDRKQHISRQALEEKNQQKADRDLKDGKNKDGFWALVVADCRHIRSLLLGSDRRSFCVYDTALPENSAHADICQAAFHEPGTPKRTSLDKKVRLELSNQFSRSTLNASEVYSR